MNPFKFTFADEYELARRIGDQRFGSECKHEHVKGGRCTNCLRRVVSIPHRFAPGTSEHWQTRQTELTKRGK